ALPSSSNMRIHAPSPRTNPSRSPLNGRDALFESSFHFVVTVPMRQNAVIKPKVMQASTPPVIAASISPSLIEVKAEPIASVERVHPVDTTWLRPGIL